MKQQTLNSLGTPLLVSNAINSTANFICFAVIYNISKENYVAFNLIIATLSIFFALASMLFTGVSINLSKEYGSNGGVVSDKIKKIISINIFSSIIIGFMVLGVSNFLADYFYAETIRSVIFVNYHRILSASIVAICIYSTIGIVMQSLGLASIHARIMIIYSAMKVFLVLLVVFRFSDEVIFNVFILYVTLDFSLVIFLVCYLLYKQMFYFKNDMFSIDNLKELMSGFRFSIPICLGVTAQRYNFHAVLMIAASTNLSVASDFNAFINIFMLILIPVISYGHALALLSGQAIGRGDFFESRKLLFGLVKYSFVYLIFSLIAFFFINYLSDFMSVLSVGSNKALLLIIIFLSYFGVQIIIPYYRSFGEVYWPQAINAIIPLALLTWLRFFYLPGREESIDEADMLSIYMILGFFPLLFLGFFGWYKRVLFFGVTTSS